MVRIFRDGGSFMVQTTCLDPDGFILDLAEAMSEALEKEKNGERSSAAVGILSVAMPIAFKLSGYKTDNVSEQRTLVCGVVSPADGTLVSSAGR